MRYFFKLTIDTCSNDINKITNILGVISSSDDQWEYELVIGENDDYIDFINYFLDILDGKYYQLEEIGIHRNNITIWMIYEYNNQCNMEFFPEDMKRLGSNGISFCISCYDEK